MPKTNGEARKAPTHFETVPLEIVKQIAQQDVVSDPATTSADEMVVPTKKPFILVPTRAPAKRR
jgi:hypothetical protein